MWLAVNRTWIKRGCEQVISFILRRITTLLCQIKHDQEEKGSSSWFLLEGLKNGEKNSLKLLKLYKFPWKTAADINCLVLKQLFHDCHRRNLKRINFFYLFLWNCLDLDRWKKGDISWKSRQFVIYHLKRVHLKFAIYKWIFFLVRRSEMPRRILFGS